MQIKRIILYGRRGGTRTLPFKLGKLNVISGSSNTGKSAILDIVDYCLGAKKCGIPDNIIRNSCSYYSVVLQDGDDEIFCCRQDPPANQDSSESIWVIVGQDLDTPPITEFQGNYNRDTLKEFLNGRCGIGDNRTEPLDGQTRDKLVANFRHALVYCLQDQGEVASKKLLFHDADNEFERQAIQDTMPFFLGAIDSDRPKLRALLREAVRQLRLAERRLEEHIAIGGQGLTKGISLLAEAKQAGLLSGTAEASEPEEISMLLESAIARFKDRNALPQISTDQLGSFDARQEVSYRRLTDIDTQLRQISEMEGAESGFESEVREQKRRLESINLHHSPQGDELCPICGSEVELVTHEAVATLVNRLDGELAGVEGSRPRFETLRNALILEKSGLSEELRQLKSDRAAILGQQAELMALADLQQVQAQFVGRAGFYIESGALSVKDEKTPLERSVAAAKQKTDEIREQLDGKPEDDRFDSALSIINREMTAIAQIFQLEFEDAFFRLDHRMLTVVADTPTGPIPLESMGSGKNWVSCHLMAHLALHKWFVQGQRPVPRFLILDQPSQVFFPKEAEDTGGDDWIPVRTMFKLLYDRVNELDGEFQIIVSDHVFLKNDWFHESIAENWWDGLKLVPEDWYS